MSETGSAVVLTLIVCVIALAVYWRQILAVIGLAIVVVFCVGAYYIVATFYP